MFSKSIQPMDAKSSDGLTAAAEDGDIVVQLERRVAQGDAMDSKQIIEYAAHCGIVMGSRVLHATVGRNNFGGNVRAGHIDNVLPKDDAMGSVIVFRIKNPLIRKCLVDLAQVYLYPQASRNTPFSYYYARRRDDYSDEAAHRRLELFRAFRAYQRIKEEKPITKNKGVSCVSFVAYMIKSALIQHFFPQGLSKELLLRLNQIEDLRKQNNKKLDAVSPELLKDFEKCALKSVSIENLELFKELYRSVKTESLGEFCRAAFSNPEFWQAGYFYYADTIAKPCVLQHADYAALDLKLFSQLKLDSAKLESVLRQHLHQAVYTPR